MSLLPKLDWECVRKHVDNSYVLRDLMDDDTYFDGVLSIIRSKVPCPDETLVACVMTSVQRGRAILAETCEHEDMVDFHYPDGTRQTAICARCNMEFPYR